MALVYHRHPDAEPLSSLYCLAIPRVGVADDAHAGVGSEDALEAGRGLRRAVGHDYLPGVDAVTYAYSSPVVDRHPGRPTNRVDKRVQDRPVGDGVAAVFHCLGLAVGRGYAARIEVVATYDDRCAQFTARYHAVNHLPEVRTFAIP